MATKVEPTKETKDEIEVECQIIPSEPDFSPVKEPASIEPMEVPHEDEDAVCHSLAKASLTPLDPPKLKRFKIVPVMSPIVEGHLKQDIFLDDLAQKDKGGVKEKPQPAKTVVDE